MAPHGEESGMNAANATSRRVCSLVTLNIRNGRAYDGWNSWCFRRRWVPEYVRSLDADIIGLQEAYHGQVLAFDGALIGYARVGVGRDDGAKAGEFCPIYVRSSRFRILEEATFWFSDTPEVPGSRTWGNSLPRICTWALLEDRLTGHRLRVANLHLDHESRNARSRSVELLLQRVAAWRPISPVVVMGDFNAGERDPVIGGILAGPDGLRDTFRAVHPHAVSVGTYHGFQGGVDGEKIDYILTTPDLAVLDAEIVHNTADGRYPSDHWPVTALLQFAEASVPLLQ
jgi:endonuclease/exonuclease/phosphatase family metal-dependent hydrolase